MRNIESSPDDNTRNERHAKEWMPYIQRGASGKGPIGTESSGEYVLVVAAGAVLPDGEPILSLLHRFSIDELADIQRAMDRLGFDIWYYPVKGRHRDRIDTADDGEPERRMVLALLAGAKTPKTLPGSTSQIITAFLATGRFEELPEPYTDPIQAWNRLNDRQRGIVRSFNPFFRDKRWNTHCRYT